MKHHWTFSFRVAGLVAGVAISSAVLAQPPLDPDKILAAIKLKGAAAVYNKELTGNNWLYLIHQMESGSPKWLEIGAQIQPATDGGPAEDLESAPGESLSRHAETVLTIAAPRIPIDGICEFSEETVGDKGYTTLKQALTDLDSRIAAVKRITNPKIATLRKQCLETLERSRVDLVNDKGLFKQTAKPKGSDSNETSARF
jgi:hypothetical protein